MSTTSAEYLRSVDLSGDPAALAAMTSKLFDHLEYLLHIAGIQPENPAFQHQRVAGIGNIPDFTNSIDVLVGINFKDGPVFGIGNAQIGNFQRRGCRGSAYFLSGVFHIGSNILRVYQESYPYASHYCFPEKIPPVGFFHSLC